MGIITVSQMIGKILTVLFLNFHASVTGAFHFVGFFICFFKREIKMDDNLQVNSFVF